MPWTQELLRQGSQLSRWATAMGKPAKVCALEMTVEPHFYGQKPLPILLCLFHSCSYIRWPLFGSDLARQSTKNLEMAPNLILVRGARLVSKERWQ